MSTFVHVSVRDSYRTVAGQGGTQAWICWIPPLDKCIRQVYNGAA